MPSNGSKSITLKDVALEAGVSIATASTALADKPSGNCRVSDAVARRVRQTAKRLRYRPNLYARRLSLQNSRTIALIVKSSLWHNFIWSVSTAQKSLHEHDCEEIFCMHDNCVEQEARYLEMCMEAKVDGVLIFPLVDVRGKTNAAKINKMISVEKVPIVQMGIALAGCRAPAVVPDEVEGAQRAVHELAKLGHRRITHLTLGGYQNANPSNPFVHAHRRYHGYQKAMDELGLTARVESVDPYQQSAHIFDDMAKRAKRLARGAQPPTAVLVYSDSLAAAAMMGFREAGRRVPQDVSILGIDRSLLTEVVRPTLSMMAIPHPELGAIGTGMLLRSIEGERVASVQLPLNFEPGQTIAPPAK